jgi:hypothetical protein
MAFALAFLKQMELNTTNIISSNVRENKVKRLLSIATMFLMISVGCTNQENSITGPAVTEVDQDAKTSKTLSTLDVEFLRTPKNVIATKFVTISKSINGVLGGMLSLNQDVYNTERNLVHVNANFQIPTGAFVGIQSIIMTVDVDNGSISFFPHMSFLNTCKLDYELQNMNLTNLEFTPSDKNAEFVYFNDNGKIDSIENLGVSLNYNSGYLSVNKAKIDHFSRYGFIRKIGE